MRDFLLGGTDHNAENHFFKKKCFRSKFRVDASVKFILGFATKLCYVRLGYVMLCYVRLG
jgi:hypothetical protein